MKLATTMSSRRRIPSLRPRVEGLEDRLVLSNATGSLAGSAQVRALAGSSNAQIRVPITVTAISVTAISQDANSGESFSGTATGTILGQTFTTPVSGSLGAPRFAGGPTSLNLDLQPISLDVVGLSIKTNAIGLNITTRTAGALGKPVGAALRDVLANASSDTSAQAEARLGAALGNSQLLGTINRALGRAVPTLRGYSAAQESGNATLAFSLGRASLTAQGISLRPDNAQAGPITVNLSATKSGGLLGGFVAGLPSGVTGRALNSQIGSALNRVTATPIPTAGQIASGTTTTPVAPPSGATPSSGTTTTTTTETGSTLITIDLKPLDLNLLGLEVKTGEIVVTVSALPGSGKLLGNLLTTVSNLINLQAVNNALNNVLSNVVTLANSASLSVSGVIAGVPLDTTTVATTPVLTAHIEPVHLDLLGAVVDTSPVDLSIVAHSGPGLLLGNVVTDLANVLNTLPKNGKLDIPFITSQIHTLNDQLNAQIPGIPAATSPDHTPPPGARNVLTLNVAPINLNLLGLVLKTDQIQVNADAQPGDGQLLGNLLNDLLNTLDATPDNLAALNSEVNNLLAKVVGVLNATSLTLPADALSSLSQALQTLALPDLINTSGTSATAPVLDLNIASRTPSAPPVDVNLLGLIVTTSDVHAQLVAQTGDGQILGNLTYNVAHLLDPGGAIGLLNLLGTLGL